MQIYRHLSNPADFYRLTIENVIHGEVYVQHYLLELINIIFTHGVIPDSLKVGLLTPIFKNKGEKINSSNYRGITVLPVLGKSVEAIPRNRRKPKVEQTQNPSQRGFTAKTSPLNSALILEEIMRV